MHLKDNSKEKTLLKLKDRLVETNEYIEYLLNTTLSFALTVPEEVNMKEKKTTNHAPRYAVEYLKPKKGKYLYHVIVTTILLFVVTMIYTYVDYNLSFSFIGSLKLFGGILLLSAALWGIAYLFKKYISR